LQQIDGYKISVADHLERVLNTLTPAVGQLPKNWWRLMIVDISLYAEWNLT